MDISDGSDAEGDVDLDENALLGSDDEDGGYHKVEHYNEDEDENINHVEDGDVLDLQLHDEDDGGLEFGDVPDGCGHRSRIAPVQVRSSAINNSSESIEVVEPNIDNYQHQMPSGYDDYAQDEYGLDGSGEGYLDDDEEDEDSKIRTRFHSERNTESNSSKQPPPFGNPIQTVGGVKPTVVDNNRQRNWVRNHGQNQHSGPRQRFPGIRNPSLLGNRPQQHNFNQGNRPRGPPRMNGPPIVQFQGRIFTDFNQSPRIPNPHNHNPQMIREQGPQLQGPRFCNPPFQQPPNGNFRPRMPMMKPQRPQMRQHGPNNNMQRYPNHNQWRHQRPQGQGSQYPQGYPPLMNHPQGPGPVNNMPFPPSHMFPPEPAHPPQMFMEQPRMHPPDILPMHFNPFGGNQHQPPIPPQTHAVPHGHGGGPLQPTPLPLPLLPPPDIHPQNILPHQNQYFNPNHQPQQQQPYFQNVSQGGWPQPRPQQEQHNQTQSSWESAPQNFMSHHGSQQIQNSAPPPNGSYILTQEQRISDVILALQQCRDRNREQKSEQKPPASYEHERYSHTYSAPKSQSHSHEEHSRGDYDKSEKSSRDRRDYDYDTYDERDRDSRYPRSQDRYNSKRKYDQDYYSGSTEKSLRLNDRLGPPTRKASPAPPPPRDEKAEELFKIREESKKTIGLDDEYIKKLEEQTRLREEILRKKAASRKKLSGVETTDEDDVKAKLSPSPTKPSIYINPKTFKGDLSALTRKPLGDAKRGGVGSSSVVFKSNTTTIGLTKPRMILKIVKDKHGNILSKSKVLIVPKEQDGRTTTA